MTILPGEFLIMILVVTGFLVMFWVIPGNGASAIIGGLLLLAILFPWIGTLPDLLPGWEILVLLLVLGITLFRIGASLFIGKSASNFMTGILAADVIRFLFTLPFRIGGAIYGAVFRRRAN